MQEIFQQFVSDLKLTTPLEYIAVFTGIISVWFSKKENILVFPIGLISTTAYIYISLKGHLPGEASVNFYYTIMSIYGWYLWSRKNKKDQPLVQISYSTQREWMHQILFFILFYVVLFIALKFMQKTVTEEAIPWADAFASATAYTGMWLMARKKIESWYWWMATNIASIPLYFTKHYVFTSVYFFILLILAVLGLLEWKKRYRMQHQNHS